MSAEEVASTLNLDEVRAAIKTVAADGFQDRLRKASPDEAHRLLPLIWPVIEELCLIADACKAELIEVKA